MPASVAAEFKQPPAHLLRDLGKEYITKCRKVDMLAVLLERSEHLLNGAISEHYIYAAAARTTTLRPIASTYHGQKSLMHNQR